MIYQGILIVMRTSNNILGNLQQYWFDGYENESPENSEGFFYAIVSMRCFDSKKNINEYMDHLNVDHTKLSYYLKVGLDITIKKFLDRVNVHNHNEQT